MADRYWRGGSGTWNSSNTANWSATSGGAGGASAPTSADNVIFDLNSGGTYTVTCGGGSCANWTVNAGTVTFNAPSTGTVYANCYGNISITAATVFTAPANGFGYLYHIPQIGGAVTVAFGSSGTNTRPVYFYVNNSSLSLTSYTWCNAATQTFNSAYLDINYQPFTCAGSTITIENQSLSAFPTDSFYVFPSTMSVAGTTINMGTATIYGTNPAASFGIQSRPPTAVEPTLTTFNVIQARGQGYSGGNTFDVSWRNPSTLVLNGFTFGNLTFKGNGLAAGTISIGRILGTNAFTLTDIDITLANVSSNMTFSGAVTLNGSRLAFPATSWTTATFSSTVNLATSSGNSSYLDFSPATSAGNAVFNGAVTMTGTTSQGQTSDNATIKFKTSGTFNAGLTSSNGANPWQSNKIIGGSQDLRFQGASTTYSLTNTTVDALTSDFTFGINTTALTVTTNPTSRQETFSVKTFTGSATCGAVSFTSTSVNCDNGAGNFVIAGVAITSTLAVNGSATTSGVTFNCAAFSVPGLTTQTTFTDVNATINGNFSSTAGSVGFALNGTTKNSNIVVTGTYNVNGPTTLNIAPGYSSSIKTVSSGGGAFTVNGTAGGNQFFTIGDGTTASTFSSTFSASNLGSFQTNCTSLTFTGAVTLTNCDQGSQITVGTNLTISNALTVTRATTTFQDFGLQIVGSFAATLTTSSTTTNWTFTNTGVVLSQFGSAMTISNPVSLVDNGGLYFLNQNLTLTSALSSSGVSKYNVLASRDSGRTLTLNGAVTLVNCHLASDTITVLGGATRNFAYSLSTPIASNLSNAINNIANCNYPEINANTFTLSTSGGTFSIAGGGSAIYRTFVGPFALNSTVQTSPSCTMSLAVNPTLTDVDFWRVIPAGAATRPWTGTRLGTVGTVANITPATPKTVYWVTGAGAWDGAKWATSSGGAGSATNYPLPQDTIIFDGNSGTGDVTYPASVRVRNLQVDAVPSGTTAVYCNATNATNTPSNFWVSGNVTGPASTPSGTFILGNTSANAYDSFSAATPLQTLVVADSSVSDTHNLNPRNISCMPLGNIQFATLGTTDIQNSITTPLYFLSDYSHDAYTITITAAQIGASSYNYLYTNAYIALGNIPQLSNIGTVDYGVCNMYTSTFYPSTTAPNTAYTINTGNLYAQSCPTLGNVNFDSGTSTVLPEEYLLVTNGNISVLNLNITKRSSSTTRLSLNSQTAGRSISMYSFTTNYVVGSSMTLSGVGSPGKPTFAKLGGGNVSVTSVNVNTVDASPSSTWYTTGTLTSATGWNSGAGSQGRGGFLLFQ